MDNEIDLMKELKRALALEAAASLERETDNDHDEHLDDESGGD